MKMFFILIDITLEYVPKVPINIKPALIQMVTCGPFY